MCRQIRETRPRPLLRGVRSARRVAQPARVTAALSRASPGRSAGRGQAVTTPHDSVSRCQTWSVFDQYCPWASACEGGQEFRSWNRLRCGLAFARDLAGWSEHSPYDAVREILKSAGAVLRLASNQLFRTATHTARLLHAKAVRRRNHLT